MSSLLRAATIIELTPAISTETISVRQKYTRMKLPDAIIYATARVYGVTLVTRNTRDFHQAMPGVRIPYAL